MRWCIAVPMAPRRGNRPPTTPAGARCSLSGASPSLDLSPTGAQPMIEPRPPGRRSGLQWRDLQLPGAARSLTPRARALPLHRGHAVMLRALGDRGTARSGPFAGCSPSDAGILRGARCCWPVTRSGSSRSTSHARRIGPRDGPWPSPRRCGRCSPRGSWAAPRLNPSATASLAWNGFIVGPGTAVQGITSLLPGQLRLYGDDGSETRVEQYWRLPARRAGRRRRGALADALEESVRRHLISDVPLGVFLSGGIDSSAVANLARRAERGPVHTFTLAFEEDEFNEGRIARRIAEAIGTEHREVILSESDFVAQLDGRSKAWTNPPSTA